MSALFRLVRLVESSQRLSGRLFQDRLGYFFLANASDNLVAAIQAFAAGAILTMLASTMMPEAYEEGGPVVGLVTSAGFLLSFVLSHLD